MKAELFHMEGQTDRMKDGWTDRRTDVTRSKVAFRNFSNTPKMSLLGITFCSGS